MQLAIQEKAGATLYLGRPRQYVSAQESRNCEPRYWSDHRFAPEVIDAVSEAIDQTKHRAHAGRIVLVGYSGSGAVAALVALRRPDVAALVTVAAPIDHEAWNCWHDASPLTGFAEPDRFSTPFI